MVKKIFRKILCAGLTLGLSAAFLVPCGVSQGEQQSPEAGRIMIMLQ